MSYYPEFAHLLNDQLLRLDRSPSWLAQRLHVNRSTVSRWLNNGSRPRDPEIVARIADVLGMVGQRQELLAAAGYGFVEQSRASLPAEQIADHPGSQNLPAQATPFIGRVRELDLIRTRLQQPDCRLLTIVGPGGMGKTRLAIEAAQAQIGSLRHGVYYVDLTPLASADLLATTILRSLDVPESGAADPRRRLSDFLQQKHMLLVLDNFEHLLGSTDLACEGVDLLPELLHAARGVKLLVTSRERLNLSEEWLQPLEGLQMPPGSEPDVAGGQQDEQMPDLQAYDATRLFVLCMRRLHPEDPAATDNAMPAEESADIAAICRLLEGMPLGIELAAAWTRALPLAEIRREMERSLDILTSPLRDVPARHRSMHAVFDHSWQLLSPHEQAILRRMSVFRGGCTRGAAAEVTEASLADLLGLVDRSWLRLNSNGRYVMHELMRQYCEEKLEDEHAEVCGETAAQVRLQHCTYYGAYVHKAIPKTFRREAIHEIMAEFGNIQAAWRCAVDSTDLPVAFDICMVIFFVGDLMGWFHFSIQIMEAAAVRLEDRLAKEVLIPADSADIVHILTLIRYAQADQYKQLGLLGEANTNRKRLCALVDRMEPGEVRTYWDTMSCEAQMFASFESGDFGAAYRLAGEVLERVEDDNFRCLVYGEEPGLATWQATAYGMFGHSGWALGDYTEAEQMYERCMALRGKVGEQRFRALNLGTYSRLEQTLGNYSRAEELARKGLHMSEGFGDRIGAAWGHLAVGRVLMVQDHYRRARAHLEQALSMGKQSGCLPMLMESLAELGRTELAEGHLDAAKRRFDEAMEAFAVAGTAHANSLVSVRLGLGWTALAQEQPAQAKEMFRKALSGRGRTAFETMDGIAGMGHVLMPENRQEEAVELFALVAHHPFTAHALRQQAARGLQELEQKLPPRTYNEGVAAGRRRELAEVLAALGGQ